MLTRLKSRWLIPLLLILIALVVWLGPSEAELGSNVRVVYLHGAWVWTALAGFTAAAVCGAVGLINRRPKWFQRSRVFGQAGSIFWITYLPISLWAMQTNWNGLYLLEPRWRIGMDFALVAILIQVAILLVGLPWLTGSLNLAFAGGLLWSLSRADQVMHPPSPIATSNSALIQTYFLLLTGLCLLLGWLVSRSLRQLQTGK